MYFSVYFFGVCVHEHNTPYTSYLAPRFQNESLRKNVFYLHENEPLRGRHFHKNGIALLTLAKAMDSLLVSLLWTREVVLL